MPLAPLHVQRDDGTANVLVVENSVDQGPRTLFEIENNGNPEFRMTNTAMGNSWVFSAGLRFVVKNNQGDWVMRVTDTGNLEIGGTLLEMSDREQKHAIVPLDGDVVLAKLAQVPITEWAYRDESADQRHIGPMAQDFYAAFGLASGEKAISARDMAGVNMAAVQALVARNAELEERIARLEKLAQQLLEPASLQVAQGD
ncbi:tail fiber domain-containing protein [Marinihelvus fidelis]|nr:tail fiber domain-containing protein [Marinihelvus fidelis]